MYGSLEHVATESGNCVHFPASLYTCATYSGLPYDTMYMARILLLYSVQTGYENAYRQKTKSIILQS